MKIANPPAPRTIEDKSLERIDKWIKIFEDLSTRITTKTYKDKTFEEVIGIARAHADENLPDKGVDRITDWPDIDDIVFLVYINSGRLNMPAQFRPEDVYVFCDKDIAFGLTYHEREGLYDEDDRGFSNNYCLGGYDKSALSWKHISDMIAAKVEEYSNKIPDLPAKE